MLVPGVVALGFVLFYFFGTPLLVYFNYKIQARPEIEIYDPAAGMPEPVREEFDRCFHELTALQFRHLGTFTTASAMKNFETVFAFYESEDSQITAGTNAMFVKVKNKWKLHGQLISMCTHFSDGCEVDTMNMTTLYGFPVTKGFVRTQHPELQKASDLLDAHRSMVEHHRKGRSSGSKLNSKFGGNVKAYFAESLFEELSRAAEAGRLRLKEVAFSNEVRDSQHEEVNPFQAPTADKIDQGSVFVTTLKGAYIAVMSNLWPIKPILSRIRFARDRKLLAETGFRWP